MKRVIKNFKTFHEDVEIDGSDIKFNYELKPKPKYINTRLGKTSKNIKFSPRITTLDNSRYKVFSAYSKKSSKETTEILKAIKKSSDYKYNLSDEEYLYFIKRTSIFFKKILTNKNIDTILITESSSSLISDVVYELIKRLPHSGIKIHTKGIYKNIENAYIDRPLKMSDSEFNQLKSSLEKSKETDNFEIKKQHAKYRKYFKNWMTIDEKLHKDIKNKNVVLFDDYITTGSTLDTICDKIDELNPNDLKIMTILKG